MGPKKRLPKTNPQQRVGIRIKLAEKFADEKAAEDNPPVEEGEFRYNENEQRTAQRLASVQSLILQGVDNLTIASTMSAEWKLSTRQVRKYIKEVRDRWRATEVEVDPVIMRAEARAQLEDCYYEARRRGDFRTCNQLLRTKLQMIPGGFAPQKIEHAGQDGAPLRVKLDLKDLNDDELADLERLAKRLQPVGDSRQDPG